MISEEDLPHFEKCFRFADPIEYSLVLGDETIHSMIKSAQWSNSISPEIVYQLSQRDRQILWPDVLPALEKCRKPRVHYAS